VRAARRHPAAGQEAVAAGNTPEHHGVGFAPLTEAPDLTRPSVRAMAGLLAVSAAFEPRSWCVSELELAWPMPQNGLEIGPPTFLAQAHRKHTSF
jgi:hypothetical protein